MKIAVKSFCKKFHNYKVYNAQYDSIILSFFNVVNWRRKFHVHNGQTMVSIVIDIRVSSKMKRKAILEIKILCHWPHI